MSSSKSPAPARTEEEIPQAIDKCIADGIIKTGSGFVLGAALSLVMFKRRSWPVILSTGIGAGMALSNCQTNLNTTNVVKRNLSHK